MTLTFCWDLAAADWIVHSDLPWSQLVGFGPAGFDAYARLRFLPDPAWPGQPEHDVRADDRRVGQLPTLFRVLATTTATPDDCYFCLWEGFDDTPFVIDEDAVYIDDHDAALGRSDVQPGVAPTPRDSRSMLQPPKVVVPHRAYWLFRGPLADIGAWNTARSRPQQCRPGDADPAFVWPSDHAWCVANDVDPHWAGIGGSSALITKLTAEPALDVVTADPTTEQPSYG